MNAGSHRTATVILGMAIFAIPVMVLAYRFGGIHALAILAWAIGMYAAARLAVYFFSRRNPAAKTAAVVLYPELLLLFFLPAHLKRSLANLKEEEKVRPGTNTNQDH